jgi:D-alanyl-D-alanine dipeptidase
MWIVMMWLALVGICVSWIPQHPSAAHEPYYASSAQRTHTELIVPALAATVDDVHIVVNAQYRLPADYVPEDLVRPNVPFVTPGNPPKNTLRRIAAQALERLVTAARAEGHTIVGVSAYRSYATQQALYKRALKRKKTAYVAPPGASEHQTGLAIDVSSPSIGYALTEAFGTRRNMARCKRRRLRIHYPLPKRHASDHTLCIRAMALAVRRPHPCDPRNEHPA